jgi:hypothetical protein
MGAQISQLLRADQPDAVLDFSQRDPNFAPQTAFVRL